MLMVPARLSVLSKMLTPRRYRDPAYAKAIAPMLYGGRMRRRPDEVRHVVYEQERLGSRTGYFLQLLAGVGWTSLPALPLIRQPTLILAGNDDPIIPLVNARIMRALLPHATLHVYDDGHLGLLTSADELGPLVSRFLTSPSGENAPTSQLTAAPASTVGRLSEPDRSAFGARPGSGPLSQRRARSSERAGCRCRVTAIAARPRQLRISSETA